MSRLGETILRACANAANSRPWLVIAATLVVTVLAGYAATGLTINTSTEEILSGELPFRQADTEYQKAFPQDDLAIAVVDGPTATVADAAGRELAARVSSEKSAFEWAELAGGSPYFDRYGFLFLPPTQIVDIGERIRPARRVLTRLADDPSLRGLADLLHLTELGVAEKAVPPETQRLLSQLAQTVSARAEGRPTEMQWSALFNVGGNLGGTRRIVQMKPVLDNTSLDRAGPALETLNSAIADVKAAYPGVRVSVTGEPVLRQQELNDAFSGALTASGLSLVLVAAILTIGIRSGRTIAALLIALVVGAIWTTGLAAVSVGRLNLISIAFMVLFFGLGIDFGTHLSLRFLEAMRAGESFLAALKRAMTSEGPNISLSALCAALAFLSFVPTPYVGIAEFGIISALGMLVALVVTFTVLPALLSVMRPKPSRRAFRGLGFSSLINRHYKAILVVAGLASVVAAYLSLNVQIDTNPLNLQNPNTEAVRAYRDLADDPETSPYALNVMAPDLEAAAALAPRLAALEGVGGVRWIGNFVPTDQDAKLAALQSVRERMGESFFAEEPQAEPPSDAELVTAFESVRASAEAIAATPASDGIDPGIPASGKELADALTRFAETKGSDPESLRTLGTGLVGRIPALKADLITKLSVSRPVTIDDIPPAFKREWIAPDGRVRLRVLPAANIGTAAAMKQFAETVQTLAPNAAGAPASVTGAGEAILLSFAEAIAYTVIAIGLVVTLLRRRISDVFLVLAPLAVAALWTVAASAALDLPFNFANVIVIPLLIGLGVASSIHIVGRARELAHEDEQIGDRKAEVLDTSTPLAVLLTQLNTVAAFATLAVAHHRGLFSMGVLLGTAIFFVLIVSLVVLPAFMTAIGVGTPRDTPAGEAAPG